MDELIKDVVIRILENNRELGSLSGDFAKGKRLAYYEILDLINSRLEILGIILLLLALKTIRSN